MQWQKLQPPCAKRSPSVKGWCLLGRWNCRCDSSILAEGDFVQVQYPGLAGRVHWLGGQILLNLHRIHCLHDEPKPKCTTLIHDRREVLAVPLLKCWGD